MPRLAFFAWRQHGAIRARPLAAGVALALAGCAALLLAVGDAIGFVDPTTEAVFTLSWIVGWMLLAWSTIVGGAVLVYLIYGVASRRRTALSEIVLVVATAAVIATAVWAHPLAGSGTGVG